jgi:hypothetical protein
MSEEGLIETLKEFEKNRVEQLKEPSRNLFYAIMKIADERDKYKTIIDKIKKTINYYAIENEDYSKIYNQEEQEIIKLLEEIE